VGCAHVGEHPNTVGIVEVSGAHYVDVMAKMPPAAPATEWMKELLVIIVHLISLRLLICSERSSGKRVEVLHMQV